MTGPRTRRLEVPGAVLAYDVRGTGPVLLLIASPMGAAGFAALAGLFPDRTVVTYDPRGAGRSRRTDGAATNTPQEHADDLHRLIAEVADGPVDVFATSGGAVNALELVTRHPEQVGTLVAHEPPAVQALPDRDEVLAASRAVADTYRRSGYGPAMAAFIALAGHRGPLPAGFAARPATDPAAFGLPTDDDGSRDDPLVGQNMVSCTHHELDTAALRAVPTRIVLAAGVGSEGTLTARATVALAGVLGTGVVPFPGDHGGFMGGEPGVAGEPEAFAATLRAVLAGDPVPPGRPPGGPAVAVR